MIGYLLLILAIPLLIYVVKDVCCLWRELKYKMQGLPIKYFPIIGDSRLYITSLGKKNEFQELLDVVEKVQKSGAKAMVYNHRRRFCASIFLTDADLIREFYLKENDVTERVNPFNKEFRLGFILQPGERGLQQRRVFSEFFKPDNLRRMIPIIRKVIRQRFEKFTDRQGKLEVPDSSLFLHKSILEISNHLMFPSEEIIPQLYGFLPYNEELVKAMKLIYSQQVMLNPLNSGLFSFLGDWGLSTKSCEVKKKIRALNSCLSDFIKKRIECIKQQHSLKLDNASPTKCPNTSLICRSQESTNSQPTPPVSDHLNIVDTMVDKYLSQQGEDPEKQVLTFEDIIGNVNLFLVASLDTTATALTSVMYNLALRTELQDELCRELEECGLFANDFELEALDSCILFNELVRECIRNNPSAVVTFEKRILKDFTLGPYTFYKGDHIVLPLGPLMWSKLYFPSGQDFNLQSINAANKKCFMPFSGGRRGCVGQLLAELQLKLFTIEVLRNYTLKTASSADQDGSRLTFNVFSQLKNCKVEFFQKRTTKQQN